MIYQDLSEPTCWQQRRRHAELMKAARLGRLTTVADIVNVAFLLAVYEDMCSRKGQAAGPDGIRVGDIGRGDMATLLRVARIAILHSVWRPGPTRAQRIPKGDGRYRTLHIHNVLDRVIFSGLQQYMAPYWERILLDSCHGFRRRRSHLSLLVELEHALLNGGSHIIVNEDIKTAFDSVRIRDVMAAHREHIGDTGLLNFIEIALRGTNPRRNKGIDQGHPYAPTSLNVLLHQRLDVPLAMQLVPLQWRYADNLVYLVDCMTEGRRILGQVTDLLAGARLQLKEGSDGIRDIRIDPVEVLGFNIQLLQSGIRYAPGSKAWQKLETALQDCHGSDDPPYTARSVIRGWITAMAPAFEVMVDADLSRIRDIAGRIGFQERNQIASCDIAK